MKLLKTIPLACLPILASCGGGGGSSEPPNTAPIVSAGINQVVSEASTVALSGSLVDIEGDATVTWSQVSGPSITFSETTSLSTTFNAPVLSVDTEIVLQITATDGEYTDTDQITIRIENLGERNSSPQGIDDDPNDRRNRERNRRNDDAIVVDNREVRTYNGSRNNETNKAWGATLVHLQRLAPNDYADGVSTLAGPLRPSARAISNDVLNQDENESIPNTFNGTDFVWQWGQFMDHDLDLTDGAEEDADIVVPEGDIYFDPNNLGGQVIPFSRALFDPDTGTGTSNPREQENEITSWIDGSMVYGSDEERALALRVSESSPFLKTSDNNLLPFNTDSLGNANGSVEDPTTLFLAGDVRVNEQLGLTVMHTLFIREHNRMAQEILDDNPGLDPNNADDGEAVFQAARRMTIAAIQKITYDEWLPVLLGANAIPSYTGYNASVNPTIYNEFSVAAFRLGHSMVNEQLLRLDDQGNEIAEGHLDLANVFFTAHLTLTTEDSLSPILRGLATQAHQKLDQKVIHDLRNFLFGAPGLGGFDLTSLNIQRGRDHGVPSFTTMQNALGLTVATSFADITSDTDLQTALQSTYGTVDQIDLWVGGLSEDPFGSSQLGELFHTILVRQFTELRDGDRFWYERDLEDSELNVIEDTTLARIIRRNTNIGGNEIQDNVFLTNG